MSDRQERTFTFPIGGRDCVVTVGGIAGQADAAVRCQYGDTLVLATVVMADSVREGTNYMPLMVDYEEKYYAAGKIKGSRFIKREGRPTDTAVTNGRMIDRTIRPLFHEAMRNDVQVVSTVLSYDGEQDPAVPALIAASTALAISRVPWNGPVGAVRVGRSSDGKILINPTEEQRAESDIDAVVAVSEFGVVMLEAECSQVPDNEFEDAVAAGAKEAAGIVSEIKNICKDMGTEKSEPILALPSDELAERIRKAAKDELENILHTGGAKKEVERAYGDLVRRIIKDLSLDGEDAELGESALRAMYRDIVRERILEKGERLNARKPDEVREIHAKTGIVPRTHGSALFERGETQILTTVTLGAPGDSMILDTMTDNDVKKRYMHFYNFPGFSVGEVKPMRGPGRRDVGHGSLAEHALARVIPPKDQFGYTIVVVSEVLASNGSSSMGSACGSSLALMDAGIPISDAVAGIAMGLVTDETKKGRASVILTDIAGMEDEGGDMDFKVAGTKQGITAVQMDTKISGLTPDIIHETLEAAKKARLHILERMNTAISSAREDLSPYAPRIVTIQINPEKIGDLIGPRGKHINEIIEQTSVEIDVEDDGLVTITGKTTEALEKAREWVQNLTRELQPGEKFAGRVTRLMKFGAFVEVLPGTEGLVHISELSEQHIRRVEDVVKVGDIIPVIVSEIDEQGRLNLSHKRAIHDTMKKKPTYGKEHSQGRSTQGRR